MPFSNHFGQIFLIPVPLGETDINTIIPPEVIETARGIRYFVAENAKSARAFLKTIGTSIALQEIDIQILDKSTPQTELLKLIEPALHGHALGLISEAGCPGVADPGAILVNLAHEMGITVKPCVGPSSILLALMASGFSGQNFAFHGYLPINAKKRSDKLKQLEKESRANDRTQIFIETPYRNSQLLESILETCYEDTKICIATDITLDSEAIISKRISEWRQIPSPPLHKRPSVFLLYAHK